MPAHEQAATGMPLTHLPLLAADLGVRLLTRDTLESAIIERAQMPFPAHVNVYSWLVDCFQRATNLVDKVPDVAPVRCIIPRTRIFPFFFF